MINTDIFVRRLAIEMNEQFAGKKLLWIASSSPFELILNFASFSIYLNFLSSVTLLRKEDPLEGVGRLWHKHFEGCNSLKLESVYSHYGERILYFVLDGDKKLALMLRGAQGLIIEVESGSRFPVNRLSSKLPESEACLTLEQRVDVPEFPADVLPWYRHKEFNAVWKSDYWWRQSKIDPKLGLLTLEKAWLTKRIHINLPELDGLPKLTIDHPAIENQSLASDFETASSIEAISWFSRKYLSLFAFSSMRKSMLTALAKRIKRIEAQVAHVSQELTEDKSAYWQHQADLIMAHLHIRPNEEGKLKIIDYITQEPVVIQVDPEKPGKTASKWYKKARNSRLLREEQIHTIHTLHESLLDAQNTYRTIEQLIDFKQLKLKYKQVQQKENQDKDYKYRLFEIEGFRVLVGKQAESNQEILRIAHKDDLWFHARGYSGSHVLIQKAGKQPSLKVIQQAAALAAFFSRGKTAGLCPVQYTSRKYVRQAKGLEPGQVIVDREEVIMVEPGLPG